MARTRQPGGARRARVARTVATALGVPPYAVLVTDDPRRPYPTRSGPAPGDLIIVTDPVNGRAWRFIPDHATPGQAWLLLDHCPDCAALIPVFRIAALADLGTYLQPHHDIRLADEARDQSNHRPDCTMDHVTTPVHHRPLFDRIGDTDEQCTVCGATNTRDAGSFPSFGGTTESRERCTACGTSAGARDCDEDCYFPHPADVEREPGR